MIYVYFRLYIFSRLFGQERRRGCVDFDWSETTLGRFYNLVSISCRQEGDDLNSITTENPKSIAIWYVTPYNSVDGY